VLFGLIVALTIMGALNVVHAIERAAGHSSSARCPATFAWGWRTG